MLDSPQVVALKKKRFDFYNENIRELKPVLNKGVDSTKIDSRELETTAMNIKGTKLEMVGTFDYSKSQKIHKSCK